MRPKFELFVPLRARDSGNPDADRYRSWSASMNGRAALYACLKALGSQCVALPVYVCDTVLEPIRRLRLAVRYYDLDPLDLNANVDHVRELLSTKQVDTVLVASMYGNPANLPEIEKLCRDNGVALIDDAAQSIGAAVGGRSVGDFGDAGFFSCAPGKPAPGSLGGRYRTAAIATERVVPAERHFLYHVVRYLDYIVNRRDIYLYRRVPGRHLLTRAAGLLSRSVNQYRERLCAFELRTMRRSLSANLAHGRLARNRWITCYRERLERFRSIRMVTSVRGSANPHKIVLIADTARGAGDLSRWLTGVGVVHLPGYRPLEKNLSKCPNMAAINGRILELPLEDDDSKMNWLLDRLTQYLTRRENR